jgi:hypothetical protein
VAQEKLQHLPTTCNHDEAQMPGARTLMKLIWLERNGTRPAVRAG